MQRGQIRARAGHEPSFWEIFFESIEDRLGTDAGATAADIAQRATEWQAHTTQEQSSRRVACSDGPEGR